MEDILEIRMIKGSEEKNHKSAQLSISIRVGSHETYCPITRICHSYAELDIEIQSLENLLNGLRDRAKELFGGEGCGSGVELRSDMDVEEIWSILSEIADEEIFINSFNGLEGMKRREVAEYVLTSCNIFSGKASVFSARYDSEPALLE
jgi:hypothetical protein